VSFVLMLRILSSSSLRSVPIMRSRIAFARGALGGLVRIWMPSAAKTASTAVANWESRSRGRNVIMVARSARFVSLYAPMSPGGIFSCHAKDQLLDRFCGRGRPGRRRVVQSHFRETRDQSVVPGHDGDGSDREDFA
jgi:hypothetical protein